MTRKKICFVVSSPYTVKAFLTNHIKALSEFYEIYVIANMENVDKDILVDTPISHIENIKIVRGISIFEDISALLKIKKYLKKEKFDAVHSVTPKAGLLGMLASKNAGVKNRVHIFTGQVWHTKKGFIRNLLKTIDRLIVKSSTQILVDGEPQRRFLIKNGILTENKSSVLGKGSISGVDIKKFFKDNDIANAVKKELSIKENDLVFMFLGRLKSEKGIMELVDAFNILSHKYDNVKLVLVGEDEENMYHYIKKNVEKSDKVVVYGQTAEPYRLLQVADVFCMPSHREGFGLSVLEASLMEKPIICSDTYGLADTVIDNVTGIRHKANDSHSLLIAMEKLYLEDALRINLGKNGRKYVLDNFKSETISKEWVKFYRKMLYSE